MSKDYYFDEDGVKQQYLDYSKSHRDARHIASMLKLAGFMGIVIMLIEIAKGAL